MKKHLALAVVFTILFCTHSGHTLTGGTNVALGQFPAHALIDIQNAQWFGGIILNQNHILTAASSVFNANNELIPAASFSVRLGLVTISEQLRYTLAAVFPHESYNPFTYENDVAVLRTVQVFPFNPELINHPIAPTVLNRRIVLDGTSCQVLGFNAPTVAAPSPPLQQLAVTIQNRDSSCNLNTVHNGAVRESMLCAIGAGGSSLCPTTRGGGLYCNNLLVGVVSFGLSCGVAPVQPAVYTQVRMHYDWIISQYNRTLVPPPGPTPPPTPAPTPIQPDSDDDDGAATIFSSIFLIISALFTLRLIN